MESTPTIKITYKLPEPGSKTDADEFKKRVFEKTTVLDGDAKEAVIKILQDNKLNEKTAFEDSDIAAVKEIIKVISPDATFDDDLGSTDSDPKTDATLVAPTRSSSKSTIATGRGRGVKPKATATTSTTAAAVDPTSLTATSTAPHLDDSEQITFDETEVSVGDLRASIENLENELDQRIVDMGYTSKMLQEKGGEHRSDAYASLLAYIRNLKGALTRQESGKAVTAEKLQELSDKLQQKLQLFRDEIAPRVKVRAERYEDITSPVGDRELQPGVRGVAIVNGVKRPASFIERTHSGRIEVSLEDVSEENNDVVVDADKFQIFASQERLLLKKEWKELREKRRETEKNRAWWKIGQRGAHSKAANDEDAAHQRYVQSMLPAMQKREQRNQEDGAVAQNLQARLPELQTRLETVRAEPDSEEKTKEEKQLERRIKNVERFNDNPEQFYRVWAVDQFIRRKKQEDNAMHKEWLSETQKESLVSIKKHLARHKWKYRSIGLGAAVLATGGAAALAGGALSTVMLAGAGGGVAWGRRFLAGTIAGGVVGGAVNAGETLKVKQQERATAKVEAETASTTFDRLINDFTSVNAAYVTAFDDLEKAQRNRTRNTFIAAGTAGFAAGGAVESLINLDTLISQFDFSQADTLLGLPTQDSVSPRVGETLDAVVSTDSVTGTPGDVIAGKEIPAETNMLQPPMADTPDIEYGGQRVEELDSGSATPNPHSPAPEVQLDDTLEPTVTTDSVARTTPMPADSEMGAVGNLDSDGFQDREPGAEIPVLDNAGAIDTTPDVQNLVPNPEQTVTIPKSGRIDTLSEAFYQKYSNGELAGLPENMSQAEFESKMWDAFDKLDNNEAIMERMHLPNALSKIGDVDAVLKGQTINVTPLIEHMNGHSIEEIETGLYTPEDALAGHGETIRQTTPETSLRPEPRPDVIDDEALSEAPAESVRPEPRPNVLAPDGVELDPKSAEYQASIPDVPPQADTIVGVSGNFESQAVPLYSEVFGDTVVIPDSYKLTLQSELADWAQANSVTAGPEQAAHIKAMLVRDHIMMQQFNNPALLQGGDYLAVYDQYGADFAKHIEQTGNVSTRPYLAEQFKLPNTLLASYPASTTFGDALLDLIKNGKVVMEDGTISFPTIHN